MHPLAPSLILLILVWGVIAAGPPCGTDRPFPICAEYIRPYSENAYVWGDICGVTADFDVLIADTVEFYDAEYGWYVVADCCQTV